MVDAVVVAVDGVVDFVNFFVQITEDDVGSVAIETNVSLSLTHQIMALLLQ